MSKFRALILSLLLAAALAVTATDTPAQSPEPPPLPESGEAGDDLSAFGPVTAPDAGPDRGDSPAAGPQSPGEEAALRTGELDTLFDRLATSSDTDWESIQNRIWAIWSKSGSDSMDFLLARAVAAMHQHDYELALRFLDDLVRLDPGFAEGWNKRATVYFLLEEYGRSVADIERTLALEPRHFGALSGLGMILERLGDKKGALTAYRRGLEVHPHLQGAIEAVERLAPDVDGRSL